MPDTNRLPRIGEIWERKIDRYRVLVLTHDNDYVEMIDGVMLVERWSLDVFLTYFEPTGTEYDLDPLILALKGDRT